MRRPSTATKPGSSTSSAITSRGAPHLSLPWRRRAPRRCSATPRWRCTRRTRATPGSSARPPGSRSLRSAGAHRGPVEGARPAREDRALPARGAALLSLRLGGRAAALRPMVREDEAAGRARSASVSRRGDPPGPRAVGRHLRALASEHSRLEHLAAAVVGAPRSRVHVHQVRRAVGGPPRSETLPHMRRPGGAGPRRARPWFLVWFVAVATLGWPERTPDLARFYP